jgi:hypothetical protein
MRADFLLSITNDFRQSTILDGSQRPVKQFRLGSWRIALQNDFGAQVEVEVTHFAIFDGRKTMKASNIYLFMQAPNVSGFKTNKLPNECPRRAAAGRLR